MCAEQVLVNLSGSINSSIDCNDIGLHMLFLVMAKVLSK